MTADQSRDWSVFNQSHLTAALATVKEALRRHASRAARGDTGLSQTVESASILEQSAAGDEDACGDAPPTALDRLCVTFGLSAFERNLLLLCAGIELDSAFAPLCAAAQGDTLRNFPTFSLALAALPDAHWSALTPDAPLRHWRLIEVGTASALTVAALRIDERVLHFLCGIFQQDERLAGLIETVPIPSQLPPSHHAVAKQLAAIWARRQPSSALPVIQLCGDETVAKRAIAASACALSGLNLCAISSHSIPQSASELDALVRLLEREAALSGSTVLVECDEPDVGDAAPVHVAIASRFIERMRSALIVSTREHRGISQRQSVSLDVLKPTTAEQRQIWQRALGDAAAGLNGRLDALVSQFNLNVSNIESACAGAIGRTPTGSTGPDAYTVWDSCRIETRSGLDALSQRIEAAAHWDDLILPGPQRQTLHQIAVHVRRRALVYESWGFAAKETRGLGISALFAGASGTGKTMAAEVLANELRLDLYRIDLSQVISKYIGETEKNLRRVFNAAETSGAILLFDEADALFGKRTEVKDSHDRYANIEVSYLLQRMEGYRGLAILTTNLKQALDAAFLRRIRFVVQFPFPDAAQRAEIWRRIFPAQTPVDGLDIGRLARLNIAGGNIRNIALHAAFHAAEAGQPVTMAHLGEAARTEYTKLERPLTEAEVGGL